MPVTIPLELEQFVQQEVASGNFQNPDEVVTEGLRLLRERKLFELRQDIDAGLAQIERGELIQIQGAEAHDAFFKDIQTRGIQRHQAKQRAE